MKIYESSKKITENQLKSKRIYEHPWQSTQSRPYLLFVAFHPSLIFSSLFSSPSHSYPHLRGLWYSRRHPLPTVPPNSATGRYGSGASHPAKHCCRITLQARLSMSENSVKSMPGAISIQHSWRMLRATKHRGFASTSGITRNSPRWTNNGMPSTCMSSVVLCSAVMPLYGITLILAVNNPPTPLPSPPHLPTPTPPHGCALSPLASQKPSIFDNFYRNSNQIIIQFVSGHFVEHLKQFYWNAVEFLLKLPVDDIDIPGTLSGNALELQFRFDRTSIEYR